MKKTGISLIVGVILTVSFLTVTVSAAELSMESLNLEFCDESEELLPAFSDGTIEDDILRQEEVEEGASMGNVYGNNTEPGNAYLINVNSSYEDNLINYEDVNWYKFRIDSPGYISLSFKHEYIESGDTFWRSWLYDSDMREITYYSFGGSTTVYKNGNIGLPAGIYYIKIDDFYTSDLDYTIQVNYKKAENWETEMNDTYGEADTINVNRDVYGSMRSANDVDWYSFELFNSGYISLKFAHDYLETGATFWQIYLYNSEYNEITEYDSTGNKTTTEYGNIGLPKGRYYIKVKAYYYSDVDYSFRVNAYMSEDWETEFNDMYEDADTIYVNQLIHGSMKNNQDSDWYRFTLSSTNEGAFNFKHEYVNSTGIFWQAYIYDSSMHELCSERISGENTNYIKKLGKLTAGEYYLKITPNYYSDVDYQIKIETVSHVHNFKKKIIKATTSQNGKIIKECACGESMVESILYSPKTMVLSTTKYVYDGSAKKPSVEVKNSAGNVINSSNYSVSFSSGRKNVGTYSVKVTFKGKYYSGTLTKTFKIVPNGTSISRLTGRKGGFSIYIKKQSAQTTGYQIQYSTNSRFLNAITKQLSGNTKTNMNCTKIMSGKKYYVRVRTYKVVSGKKYYSSWSDVKSVITKK